MPRKVYKKKPFASKKRTTVPKKRTVRKSASLVQPVRALATVATQHNKMLMTLFDKIHFQYRSIAEGESNTGNQVLAYTSGASITDLPLHVYDLTAVNTEGTKATPFNTLQFNSASLPYFTNVARDLETVGVEDGSEWNNTMSHNKTFMDHINLRIELFGRDIYKTKYRLMLIRFTDDELGTLWDSASSTRERFNAFWKTMVRPHITNSMIPQDPLTKADLSNRFKIVWEKTYTISEKSADYDQNNRKLVKIFRKVNQIKTYNENPRSPNGGDGDDDPADFDYPLVTSYTGNSTTQCRIPQRLYLVICANQSVDLNSATGYDASATTAQRNDRPTYNIWYDVKHTVPQARS